MSTARVLRNLTCLLAIPALALPADQPKTDVDPLALEVLKAATDSIRAANTFSFRARISKERLATNYQKITYFQDLRVVVSKPNKMRADIDGQHHDVQFLFDGSEGTLFEPEKKLYATFPAPKNLDLLVDALDKRGTHLPIANFLESDPYKSLSDGLKAGYVIGRVNISGKTFNHLAFTEDGADWQLWVEPADKPVPRRLEVIYKKQQGAPRVTVDFMDWNLAADPAGVQFTFTKPDGANKIDFAKSER